MLANYTAQQKSSKGKQRQQVSDVYATYTPGTRDGYVTATVQGDGIHTLDVSEIHPVAAHTFGPSTLFAGPSVARCTDGTCSTYAVVAASSDVTSEDAGRTIWKWDDDLSGSLPDSSSSSTKQSVTVPHIVSCIRVTDECPSTLLAWSPSGHLTLLGNDLKIRTTRDPPSQRRVLVQSFLVPSKPCAFVPSQVRHENDAIAICLEGDDRTTRARVLAVRDVGEVADVADLEISVPPENIASCTLSPTGFLTVLLRDGIWQAYQLSCSSNTFLTSLETIKLRSVSFVASSKAASDTKSPSSHEVALLALGSSHVLLAATAHPSRDLVLHIWDLAFSVLLATQTITLPSALAEEKRISIALAPAGAGQCVLVLSPAGVSGSARSNARSTVYVVPYSCPPASTIAHAMGRAEASKTWLAQHGGAAHGQAHEPKRAKLLKTIEGALASNRPQAADEAFAKWFDAEGLKGTCVTEKVRDEKSAKNEKIGEEAERNDALGHAFVRDLLDRVLRPAVAGTVPYSPEIVRQLIKAGVVSAGMIDGSALLTALRRRNDWGSIQLVLSDGRVRDIPEVELADGLAHVVARASTPGDANAMQVDVPSTSDAPALPVFLALCVAYPASPSALRVALRRSLADAGAVLAILDVLQGWLARWAGMRGAGLATAGSKAKRKQRTRLAGDMPELPEILRFLTALLDATYVPVLLQHAPAGRALRRLLAHVTPEVDFLEDVVQLRGPLEPFVRAQTEKEQKQTDKEQGKDRVAKEPQGDWRQRRRAAHEAASAGVGLYRLEELTL